MNKRPLGRIIASVIAGLLAVAGIYFLVESHRIRHEFYQRIEEKLIDLEVDLSQPGEFSGEFQQTWSICHRQAINLHVPSNLASQVSPSKLLTSLEFKCRITDSNGDVVADDKSAGHPIWQDRLDDDEIPLLYFHPFDKGGTYTLTLTIIRGAPRLAGVPQRLVGRYQPCGIELLPAFFAIVIGIASLVVAAIIFLVVVIITKRKKNQSS